MDDSLINAPFCPLPSKGIGDLIPMLVVLAVFLGTGWLLRRWKKRRAARKNRSGDTSLKL